MDTFKLPGEHVYKGLTFGGHMTVAVLEKIPDFSFRKDDVLIATYPKAGTTWLQQITWLIVNNTDVEASRKELLHKRSRFLEYLAYGVANTDVISTMKSPRVIKTHLPCSFFKASIDPTNDIGLKVIVGLRDPKDVLVSLYHFYRMNKMLGNFEGSFDDFFGIFCQRRLIYGDYFDHTLGWWEQKDNPNVYFVKYEDLQADAQGEIGKLSTFLGRSLSEAEVTTIVEESSFNAMKQNPMANHHGVAVYDHSISEFIRKGEVGDWVNYFDESQRQFVDGRCSSELEPHGLMVSHDVSSATSSGGRQ